MREAVICCSFVRCCAHALRRRKLPALDSKAAIRENREKEIKMKVNLLQKRCLPSCRCPDALAGTSAAEKIDG